MTTPATIASLVGVIPTAPGFDHESLSEMMPTFLEAYWGLLWMLCLLVTSESVIDPAKRFTLTRDQHIVLLARLVYEREMSFMEVSHGRHQPDIKRTRPSLVCVYHLMDGANYAHPLFNPSSALKKITGYPFVGAQFNAPSSQGDSRYPGRNALRPPGTSKIGSAYRLILHKVYHRDERHRNWIDIVILLFREYL